MQQGLKYYVNAEGELKMKTQHSSIRVDGFAQDVFGRLCTVTVHKKK